VTTATYDGTGLSTSKAIAYRMMGRSKSPDAWLGVVNEGRNVEKSLFQRMKSKVKECFPVRGNTIEEDVCNYNTSDPADTLESALYMTANDLRDSQETLNVDYLRTARNALVKQAKIYAQSVKAGNIKDPKITTRDFKHVFNLIQGRIAYEQGIEENLVVRPQFSLFFKDNQQLFGGMNFSRQYDFQKGTREYSHAPREERHVAPAPQPKKSRFRISSWLRSVAAI